MPMRHTSQRLGSVTSAKVHPVCTCVDEAIAESISRLDVGFACRACMVTHVLLPAAVLLRRAYAAERIWATLTARAEGSGHRGIGGILGIASATVRGWLRRAAQRLEAIRSWFLGVAVVVGVDVKIPEASGCRWRDALAAVGTATAAIRFRFGAAGLLGAVTPARVAVAATGGRLLAPRWSPPRS